MQRCSAISGTATLQKACRMQMSSCKRPCIFRDQLTRSSKKNGSGHVTQLQRGLGANGAASSTTNLMVKVLRSCQGKATSTLSGKSLMLLLCGLVKVKYVPLPLRKALRLLLLKHWLKEIPNFL